MTGRKISNAHRRRGSELVEFALVSFQLFLLIFAVVEFGRMALVYSSVANAARVAVRYAAVHGNDRSPVATYTDVCGVVTSYTSALKTAALTCSATSGGSGSRIEVTWPDGDKKPGSRVVVTVVYNYDPFTVLPLGVNLGTTTEGMIMY
jgi:Flp pilus assembly protein TadG